MSTTIDERVVEMRFDNKQFESNVATSMSTLEKLKKSLNLSGASKGLEDVNAAAKKVDMSGLGGAVESVKAKFSVLDVVAVTALANIANSAVNAGKRIVSALTIEPVMSGFKEYETQINAVQTILANTSMKGTTLDQVNAALDELNHYADLTIYNFTEMTRNIGTFTAAGIDLETSVNAIQGIANLAAVSGSTSQQASTAMYQLSQALASGTVKLMDWNSVVNAGMGGEVFQNALKETSRLLGTGADAAIEAEGSFRESLRTGWLTAEVLTETLKKFTTSGANEYVAKYTGLSVEAVQAALDTAKAQYGEADAIKQASKALAEKTGKNAEEIESMLTMAKTAEDAATKVKTFSQLWDTLKEAAQSGWTQSWELMLGDFEEAKEFFTDVHGLLSGLIEKSANARNNLLGEVLTSPWDNMISKINEAGIETDVFEKKVRECAEASGGDLESLIEKYGSLKKAFQNGADISYLKEALKALSGTTKEITKEITKGLSVDLNNFFKPGGPITLSWGSTDIESVKKVQTALTELGFTLESGVTGIFGAETRNAIIEFQKSVGLVGSGAVDQATIDALIKAGDAIERIGEVSEMTGASVDGLLDGIDDVGKVGGRELLVGTILNSLKALVTLIETFREAWGEIFTTERMSAGLYKALDALHSFSEKLILSDENAEKLKRTFRGVASVFDIVWQAVKAVASGIGKLLGNFKGLGGGILDITASIGDYLTGLRDSVTETGLFGSIVDKVVGVLSTVVSAIKNGFSAGKEFGKTLAESFEGPDFSSFIGFFKGLLSIITDIGSAVANVFGNIGKTIAEVLGKGDIVEVLNTGLIAGIILGIKKFISSLTDAFDGVGGFVENITGILNDVRGCLQAYQNQLNASALLKIAGAVAILAGSLYLMSTIDEEALGPSIAAIGSLFAMLVGAMALMNKIATPGAKNIDRITNSLSGMVRMFSMIGLASAVLILAGAMKILSGIDLEGILRSLSGLMGIVAILVYATKAMDSESSKITKFAGQMILMAAAVGAMSLVAKYLSSMSWEELAKGGAGLLGIVTILVYAAKYMDSESSKITKFAGQMILMAAAVGAMSLVAKLFASMSWEELAKGGAGVLGAVIILIAAAKIMNKGSSDITKFAGQMILMSVAVGALALVAKLFASMSWEELAKGGAGVLGAVIILVAVAKIMDSKFTSITKFAGQMILMSIAVGILSASMKLISTIGWDGIAKGLVSIAGAFVILGLAGYILGPIAPAILMLAGAFTLLGVGMLGIGAGLTLIAAGITALGVSLAAGATSIVAAITVIVSGILELVPTIARIIGEGIVELAKVIGEYAPQLATSGLQLILSVLQTLAANAPQITDALFELLIGVINSLSGHAPALVEALVNLMSSVFKGLVDALKTIGVEKIQDGIDAALGLSALMVAMAAALKVAGGIRIGSALKGVLVLTAMAVPLLAFVGVLALADGIDNAMTNALALAALVATCSLMLLPLTLIGGFIGPALLGVVSLLAMTVPMLAFIGILALMNHVNNASSNALALSDFIESISGVLIKLSAVAPLALIGVGAMASLALLMGAIGVLAVGVGALMENFPSIQKFLNTGLPVLEQLAGSIGTMIANFTTAFVGGVGSSLVKMGEDISTFMAEIAKASENAAGIDGSAFNGVKDLLLTLVEIGGTSVLTSITDLFTVFTTGQTSLDKFGSDGVAFFNAMKKIGEASSEVNINEESMDSIIAMAGKLVELQSSIEPIGGVIDFFNGRNDLGTFGANAASFISSMQEAMGALSGVTFNEEAMGQIISAATGLSTLQSSLEPMGGVIGWFNGRSDLGTFGTKIGEFATAMGKLKTNLGEDGLPESVVTSVTNAGNAINELQAALPTTSWFDGKMDLSTFSGYVDEFGTAISGFSSNAVNVDTHAINNAINAAYRIKTLATVVSDLDTSGLIKLTGNSISDGAIVNIGQAMSEFSNEVSDIDVSAVATSVTAATRLKALINTLADLDTSGVENFKPVDIGDALKSYSNTVVSLNIAAIDKSIAVANKIKAFISNLSSFKTGGIDSFKSAVDNLSTVNLSGVSDMMTEYSTTMQTSGVTLANSLNSGLQSGLGVIKNTINSMLSKVLSSIMSKTSAFRDVGRLLSSGLASGISSGRGNATSSASSVASSAANSARGKYTSFYAAGAYLVNGFCNGISENTFRAEAKAAAMAKAAYEAARKELDINSPSKVFKRLGTSVPEGFAIGLSMLGNEVESSASGMASVAINTTRDAMATVLNTLNADIDSQPTIRPIMDLSDVKTGADAIRGMFNGVQTIGVRSNLNAINASINRTLQNGSNDDIISAINKLNDNLGNVRGDTYTVGNVTYDDGSNVSDAIKTIVRYARIGGRV